MCVLSPRATWCLLISRVVGNGVEMWQELTGDGVLLMKRCRLGVRKRGLMDTADRPVRKFGGKEEEAPWSGHSEASLFRCHSNGFKVAEAVFQGGKERRDSIV